MLPIFTGRLKLISSNERKRTGRCAKSELFVKPILRAVSHVAYSICIAFVTYLVRQAHEMTAEHFTMNTLQNVRWQRENDRELQLTCVPVGTS